MSAVLVLSGTTSEVIVCLSVWRGRDLVSCYLQTRAIECLQVVHSSDNRSSLDKCLCCIAVGILASCIKQLMV